MSNHEDQILSGDFHDEGHVINVTTTSFEVDVLQRSMEIPVVLDLWATWCEPCKQLSPILEKLAVEYAGEWILAKVDVDQEPQIATAFQVQSIPSIFGIVNGQPIPLFQGAQAEAQIRPILDELLKVALEQGLQGSASSTPMDSTSADSARKTGSLGYGSAGKKAASRGEDEPRVSQGRLGYGSNKTGN